MKKNISFWQKHHAKKQIYPTLKKTLHIDIAIIGGGITGITCAYLLAKAGRQVALFEKDTVASGETARTTAFLNYPIDASLQYLSKQFDKQTAKYIWQSAQDAIDLIESIIHEEHIKCDFQRCPLYLYAKNETQFSYVQKEFVLAQEMGFPSKLLTNHTGLQYKHAIEFLLNAKFHPINYVTSLAQKAEKYGALLFEQTPIIQSTTHTEFHLKTPHANIFANTLIVATHTPITKSTLDIQTRLQAQQTYVMAGTLQQNNVLPALYIDTQIPYHYLRIEQLNKKTYFLMGGGDHLTDQQTKQTKHVYKQLEKELRQLIPNAQYEITHTWSGEIFVSNDYIPYIGKSLVHKQEYYATGFAGDGMTLGTLGAKIIYDMILQHENKWEKLYSGLRFHHPMPFIKQGMHYLKHLLTKKSIHEITDIQKIQKDSGAMTTIDGEKIAAYKTKEGKLITCSGVCTHMKCLVVWNDLAKTWDCPCHGSRFTKEGQVISGPANKPLQRIHNK